jgi:hypothetical protein
MGPRFHFLRKVISCDRIVTIKGAWFCNLHAAVLQDTNRKCMPEEKGSSPDKPKDTRSEHERMIDALREANEALRIAKQKRRKPRQQSGENPSDDEGRQQQR